jgi:hypothetical protein
MYALKENILIHKLYLFAHLSSDSHRRSTVGTSGDVGSNKEVGAGVGLSFKMDLGGGMYSTSETSALESIFFLVAAAAI